MIPDTPLIVDFQKRCMPGNLLVPPWFPHMGTTTAGAGNTPPHRTEVVGPMIPGPDPIFMDPCLAYDGLTPMAMSDPSRWAFIENNSGLWPGEVPGSALVGSQHHYRAAQFAYTMGRHLRAVWGSIFSTRETQKVLSDAFLRGVGGVTPIGVVFRDINHWIESAECWFPRLDLGRGDIPVLVPPVHPVTIPPSWVRAQVELRLLDAHYVDTGMASAGWNATATGPE